MATNIPSLSEELRLQLVPGDLENAENFAESRCRRLRLCSPAGAKDLARDIVHQIIVDTLDGTLRWDVTRIKLVHHLLAHVKCRTRHEYVKQARWQHVVIDSEVDEQDRTDAAHRETCARLFQAVHRRIGSRDPDADVLKLLKLYGEGVTRKSDVEAATGWSSSRYRGARHRLRKLAGKPRLAENE